MSKTRRSFQITSVTSSNYSQSAPSFQGGSSSLPTSPSLIRKSSSRRDDATGGMSRFSDPTSPLIRKSSSRGDATGGVSRFRVVRLAGGRGQPHRRGRWTCVDFLEREERAGLMRLMDKRLSQSLESLDAVGQDGEGGGVGPRVHALRGAGHHVHSHGTSHFPLLLANQGKGEGLTAGVKPLLLRPDNPPTSPTYQPIRAQPLDGPPLRLDVDSAGRSVLRLSVSPGVSQPDLNPSLTLPGDSGVGSSMDAIDNKIEQAMDLVKSHLQTAVREEVEFLRVQIKDLQERNDDLERENYLLRTLHTHT